MFEGVETSDSISDRTATGVTGNGFSDSYDYRNGVLTNGFTSGGTNVSYSRR